MDIGHTISFNLKIECPYCGVKGEFPVIVGHNLMLCDDCDGYFVARVSLRPEFEIQELDDSKSEAKNFESEN